MSTLELVIGTEQVAMQLFTLHQVETTFRAVAKASDNVSISAANGWPDPNTTTWENIGTLSRETWRQRARKLLIEATAMEEKWG